MDVHATIVKPAPVAPAPAAPQTYGTGVHPKTQAGWMEQFEDHEELVEHQHLTTAFEPPHVQALVEAEK